MSVGTRTEAERLLAKALSRHIGYTSGAYDLSRIVSTIQPFATKTSVYKDELVAFLASAAPPDQKNTPHSTEYLADIISFATSMDLLEPVSARDARLTRYACTELGRSLLGAQAVCDTRFLNFYLAQIVLRADADYILPILVFNSETSHEDLIPYFLRFQRELRERRLQWLHAAFPERVLLERVASQVPWLKRARTGEGLYELEVPTANTARHHATPRNGWIEQLGMYNKAASRLTAFGVDVARALAPVGEYFWLAPSLDALQSLGLSIWPDGQFEDDIRLREDVEPPSPAEIGRLVEDVARVMRTGYNAAKLVHASQASLQLPIEYVNYRAYTDGRAYLWVDVLERLFQMYRDTLQRFSAHRGRIGFYKAIGG